MSARSDCKEKARKLLKAEFHKAVCVLDSQREVFYELLNCRIRSPHFPDLPPFSSQPGCSAGERGCGTRGLPGAAAAGPGAHAGACWKTAATPR
jgi:hypothetical protein